MTSTGLPKTYSNKLLIRAKPCLSVKIRARICLRPESGDHRFTPVHIVDHMILCAVSLRLRKLTQIDRATLLSTFIDSLL